MVNKSCEKILLKFGGFEYNGLSNEFGGGINSKFKFNGLLISILFIYFISKIKFLILILES
jgi:hypothetical protein